MRIRLHEKFDWRIPGTRSVKHFPVGDHTMTHEAGAEAIRTGKGKEIEKPAKGEKDAVE